MKEQYKMWLCVLALVLGLVGLILGAIAISRDYLSLDGVKGEHISDNAVGQEHLDESDSYEMVDLTLTGDLQRYKHNLESITGAKTLAATDTGKVFLVKTAAGGYTITLPSVSGTAGVNYSFILAVDALTAAIVVTAGSAIMHGSAGQTGGAASGGTAKTTVEFAATNSSQGDRLNIVSDGTNWYFSGEGDADGSFVVG